MPIFKLPATISTKHLTTCGMHNISSIHLVSNTLRLLHIYMYIYVFIYYFHVKLEEVSVLQLRLLVRPEPLL